MENLEARARSVKEGLAWNTPIARATPLAPAARFLLCLPLARRLLSLLRHEEVGPFAHQNLASLADRERVERGLQKLRQSAWLRALRLAEGTCGPGVARLLIQLRESSHTQQRHTDYPQFLRLRAALPSGFWKNRSPEAHFHRMFQDWDATMVMTALYDRLAAPRWQRRFTIRGTPPHQVSHRQGKPVVLAFLHTGPFGFLKHWLRAQGIPAALFLKAHPSFSNPTRGVRAKGDLKYGLTDVPHLFGLGSVRKAVRFLRPGRLLLISLEQLDFSKPRMTFDVPGAGICLDEGAFRIARMAGALLMPAAVRQQGLRFDLMFGNPVPSAVMQAGDVKAANAFLLHQLWHDIQNDPTALTWTSMEALAPGYIAPRGHWP